MKLSTFEILKETPRAPATDLGEPMAQLLLGEGNAGELIPARKVRLLLGLNFKVRRQQVRSILQVLIARYPGSFALRRHGIELLADKLLSAGKSRYQPAGKLALMGGQASRATPSGIGQAPSAPLLISARQDLGGKPVEVGPRE